MSFSQGETVGSLGITFDREIDEQIGSTGKKYRHAVFSCFCGSLFEASIESVKRGRRKSCGCANKDVYAQRNIRVSTTHGLSKTRAYSSYTGMMQRCYDESFKDYKYYGGKGIKVCERWLEPLGQGVTNFYLDMGERPMNKTLDRVDSNKNYTPENCIWSDLSQQAYNQGVSVANKSGRVGVSCNSDGTYTAAIGYKGKSIHLINTRDKELAIFCREEAEVHYYGSVKPSK